MMTEYWDNNTDERLDSRLHWNDRDAELHSEFRTLEHLEHLEPCKAPPCNFPLTNVLWGYYWY
jgi:hypothetical protein